MDDAVIQLADKLEARLVRVTEETLVTNVKTVDANNNKSFTRGAFRRANREKMTQMLEVGGVCKAIESAMPCVATSSPMFQAVSNMVVKEKNLMASVSVFVAEQPNNEVRVAGQQSVSAAPLSPTPSPSESSSSEEARKPPRRKKSPKRKKALTSLELDDRKTWSRQLLIKGRYRSKTSSSKDKPKELRNR